MPFLTQHSLFWCYMHCFFLFVFSVGFNTSSAQVPLFDHITTRDGLSQNHINCIFQDADGFIWVGTFNGLNRYDAYSFNSYYNEATNSKSISHQSVNTIFQDSKGRIWLGTEHGLNLYNAATNNFIRYYYLEPDLSISQNNDINTIYESEDGVLWVGFYGGGLKQFYPGTGQFKTVETLINKGITRINAFYADNDNMYWLGTEQHGLIAFNPKQNSIKAYSKQTNPALSDSTISVIRPDKQNRLWIGTWAGGLAMFNKETEKFTSYRESSKPGALTCDAVTSLTFDNAGGLWVGTFREGLCKLDTVKRIFKPYKNDPSNKGSLSSNVVWTTYMDRSGVLWIGTYGGGLNKYSPLNSEFKPFRVQENNANWLNNNFILSFFEGANSDLFIGTSGSGVNVFDRQKQEFIHLLSDSENKGRMIRCLFEDADQQLWVGTDAGVFRFDKTRTSYVHYKLTNDNSGIGSSSIYSITQDRKKNIWFGSWNGTLKMLKYEFTSQSSATPHFESFENMPFLDSIIWNIFSDSEGSLWIGASKSLYKLNPTTYELEQFLPKLTQTKNSEYFAISCFYEDTHNNQLWFGTLGNGIGRFDLRTKEFIFFSRSNGLANEEIFNIAIDKSSNIWMSSNNGLFRYDLKLKQFLSIPVSSGEYNEEIIDRLWQLKSGELIVGGNKGFYIFNPDKFFENTYTPDLVFTDFKVFNESVIPTSENSLLSTCINKTEQITMPYSTNVFSLEFAALDYREPKNNKYEYMLEGFDRAWVKVNADNRKAAYTNLDGGHYTLKVRATNSDGLWSDKMKSIDIYIVPPFYETWTFRLFIAFLVALLAYAFYRLKIFVLKKRLLERDLSRIEQELTFERNKYKMLNNDLEAKLSLNTQELATRKLYIQNKDESLLTLRHQLLGLIENAKESQKIKIKNVLNSLDKELKEKEGWNSFRENIDILQNDVITRLAIAYPNLTQKDLKTCSYIIMGKTNKDIAELLSISVKSVEMSRYRIRKKMDVDSKISLNDFLIRF